VCSLIALLLRANALAQTTFEIMHDIHALETRASPTSSAGGSVVVTPELVKDVNAIRLRIDKLAIDVGHRVVADVLSCLTAFV
jgi:hypothetical protein